MNIEVIDVSLSEEPSKFKGKKNIAMNITFKGEDGRVDAKKMYDWATDKNVWTTLVNTEKGTVLNIETEKNARGYWDWTGVHRQDGPMAVTPAKLQSAPIKPTYETSEERAQRQVMIVRQSSIASAVNLLGPGKDPGEVVKVARFFESYVMGTSIYDLQSDIPN